MESLHMIPSVGENAKLGGGGDNLHSFDLESVRRGIHFCPQNKSCLADNVIISQLAS